MNKPILVNNNTEWLRLTPVLDKQGYVWAYGKTTPKEWNPYEKAPWGLDNPITIYLHGNTISWSPSNEAKTQSVDEYLLSLENPMIDYDSFEDKAVRVAIDNLKKNDLSTNAKNETVEAVNCCGRCIDGLDECVLEFKEHDYKALYEAQTRAIEEALVEIEARAKKWLKDDGEQLIASGLREAKEILTNKLK